MGSGIVEIKKIVFLAFIVMGLAPWMPSDGFSNELQSSPSSPKAEKQNQVHDRHLREALDWLKVIRQRHVEGTVEAELGFLRNELNRGKIPLSQLGLSESDLENFLQIGRKSEASYWLKLVESKSAKGNVEDEAHFFRNSLKLGGYRLSDFRKTEEDLSSLVLLGFENEAKKWLREAQVRKTAKKVDDELDFFLKYREKSGRELAYFGIDDEGLRKLRNEGHASETKYWIKFAKERVKDRDVKEELELVRKYQDLSGVSLQSLGSSEAELQMLADRKFHQNSKQKPKLASGLSKPNANPSSVQATSVSPDATKR